MYLPVFLVSSLLVTGEAPCKERMIADYYQRTGHPGVAEFYRRIADKRTREQGPSKEATIADFYRRTGHPGAAEFYRRIAARRVFSGE